MFGALTFCKACYSMCAEVTIAWDDIPISVVWRFHKAWLQLLLTLYAVQL
jgi:hypothetical protein